MTPICRRFLFEEPLTIFKNRLDCFINHTVLDENLSKLSVAFGRLLPWVLLSTLVGYSFRFFVKPIAVLLINCFKTSYVLF